MERVREQQEPSSRQGRRHGGRVGRAGRGRHGVERELDGLLDEVDAVLEENAEEFVKAYIQKGGE